jgi:mono/diheme cytochrome c family protein
MTSDTPIPANPNPEKPNPAPLGTDGSVLADPVFTMHLAAMREMSEPRDGVSPTPVSYILMCFALLMWGGWYIGTYGGDWTGKGLSEKASTGPAKIGPAQDPMVVGKEVFGSCMQCHQETGLGLPGQYPPLAGSEFVLGDKRRMAAIILNGLSGPVTVKGANFSATMPPWATRDDEEIAGVMTYVRNSFGNKAEPVTPAFVAAVRKEVENKGEWKLETLNAFAATAPPAPLPGAAPAAAATPAAAPPAAAPVVVPPAK